MPKTYSIIISDICSEQLLARTLWSVSKSKNLPLEVVVRHDEPLSVLSRFSSILNIWQGDEFDRPSLAGEVGVRIYYSPILLPDCLDNLVEACTAELSVKASLYRLPADAVLSLDELGANLQNRHVYEAMKHPLYTRHYVGNRGPHVLASCGIAPWEVCEEAVALEQEI